VRWQCLPEPSTITLKFSISKYLQVCISRLHTYTTLPPAGEKCKAILKLCGEKQFTKRGNDDILIVLLLTRGEVQMKTDFAEMLSSLRREKGISQKKAAKDLQISQALLSHYENGVREPKFEFVHKACLYYGVSADYILGRLKTDTISVSCGSPYMMDMLNDAAQLVDNAEKLSDDAVAAVSAYVKSVIAGVEKALQDPNHPADFEETARQQQLLAELYKALRANN